MKQLHELVNIVPVIAKADTLTPSEVQTLKKRVSDNKMYESYVKKQVSLNQCTKRQTLIPNSSAVMRELHNCGLTTTIV